MSARRRAAARPRAAATLVELLVVLAVMGVMLSVAGLAFRRVRTTPSEAGMARERVVAARREAIATGRAVSTTVVLDGRLRAVTAYADGRVLADSLPPLDSLSHARP